jgi:hypothetical protein
MEHDNFRKKRDMMVAASLSAVLICGLLFSLNSPGLAQMDNSNQSGSNATTSNTTGMSNVTTSTDATQTSMIEEKISECDFEKDMRKLWVDHVVYTRQFIVDSADDLDSLNETTNRLLENQEDIGDAIKPFYGDDAGNQLTDLLKEHILIAADLVNAAKEGNDTGVQEANATWFQNADDIAAFLAGANPNWDEDEMKDMLHEHLAVTTEEAVARLQGNYTADIEAFDKVHEQAMDMADGLSSGIIAQFPERFEDGERTS